MAEYTTEQEFSFGPYPERRAISVTTHGGTLVVSRWGGDIQGYVIDPDDTITADTTNTTIFTQNSNIKLTPTGGAVYSIDEAKLWES